MYEWNGCNVCGVRMLAHPSLPGWLKCNSCGYCKQDSPPKPHLGKIVIADENILPEKLSIRFV